MPNRWGRWILTFEEKQPLVEREIKATSTLQWPERDTSFGATDGCSANCCRRSVRTARREGTSAIGEGVSFTDDMMAEADSAWECWIAISGRKLSDKETASIMSSRHLAGYLKKCFAGWLKDIREGLENDRRDVLVALIQDQSYEEQRVTQSWLGGFETWVAWKFGEDALNLTVDPYPEKSGQVRINFATFIPRLKFHYALDCMAPVTLDRLVDESIDEHAADVAWFAAGREPFVSALRKSGDPPGWFNEHRHEVEEAMASGESPSDELE
jgi:hypothetical protein